MKGNKHNKKTNPEHQIIISQGPQMAWPLMMMMMLWFWAKSLQWICITLSVALFFLWAVPCPNWWPCNIILYYNESPIFFSCPYFYNNTHCEELLITSTFFSTITLETLEKLWLQVTAWSKFQSLWTCCLWNVFFFKLLFLFFTRSATTCSQLAF